MRNEIKWSIDQSHSEIAFKVKHLMIANVKGNFKTFDGSIYTTGKDFRTVNIDLWIDPSTIFTGDAKRDEHLTGADFFDVKNYKQITFTASGITKPDTENNSELWGELTIKGITKNIKLIVNHGGIVKDPWEKEKAGFAVTGTIKRSDWGLVWNTKLHEGGLMVSDEIKISCEIELVNMGKKDLVIELEPETNLKANLN